MKNRLFLTAVIVVVCSWIVVACSLDEPIAGDGTESTTTTTTTTALTVSLSQSALTLTDGTNSSLTLVCNDATAATSAVWSSSNDAVATVDQNGKVTAVSEGTATITVTVSTLQATCLVTVTSSDVATTAVAVSPTSATLSSAGSTRQLTASVTPSNATNVSYTWSSSDTSVATVTQSGLVTAVANGTTVITVTTNSGLKATATITVSITAATSTVTTYSVNSAYCTGCGNCRSVCPSGAITISGRKAYIDQSKCTACGKCYSRCGRGAIVKTVTNN